MRYLLPLTLLALVACSPSATPAAGPAVQEISGVMPELAGATLDGGELEPTDLAGRVVVVNFWATWCGPCRREQPELSRIYEAGGPDGPLFVGINYRDDAVAARAYLEEFDVAYPSLEDPAGTWAYRFGVPFLPTTVVIDEEGQMRFRVTGEIDGSTLEGLIARASS